MKLFFSIIFLSALANADIKTNCNVSALQSFCTFTNSDNLTKNSCVEVSVNHMPSGQQTKSVEVCSGDLAAKTSSTQMLSFSGLSPMELCLGKNLSGSWDQCKIQVEETSSGGGLGSMVFWFGVVLIISYFSKPKSNEKTDINNPAA